MTTINKLSAVDSLQDGDNFPVYSNAQGDTRRASMTTLAEYLNAALSTDELASFKAQLLSSVSGNGASLVGAVGETNVQLALDARAKSADLASTATGKGASLVALKKGGTVEDALDYVVNARMFGAKFDGVTDDTAAINAAIAALVAISGSFTPASSFVLQLPPGRAITQGGHIIPSGIKVRVVGAGAYTTVLYQKNGTNAAFMLDLQGQYQSVEHLSINGNRDNNATGTDCLRVNGAFCMVDRVFVTEASADGIVLGNSATAINSRMSNVDVRYCKGYGVNIASGFSTTDCQFTDVNIGTSGKSGFRIASSGQKLVNCHSWGNGIEDAADNDGFRMVSGGSMLVGCEAESNLGDGIYIGSGVKGISIVGGTLWGNVSSGVYGFNATHCIVSGVSIRNNGVANAAGASSNAFANVNFDQCTFMITTGCSMYDDGQNFPAGVYRTAPPYPYPGRTGIFTVSRHYAEGTLCNDNVIVGNNMPAAQSRSGVAIVNVGTRNRYSANATGITTIPSQGSLATFTPNVDADLINVTGTTAITTITAQAQGRRVTLRFASAGCVVTNGSNISIGSNYTSTGGDSLTLICDGTNWYRT